MLGEPVAMPSGEEGEEYDYEGADFGASLEPIDEEGGEGGEDRFFGLKCVKFAGVCNALCVSNIFIFYTWNVSTDTILLLGICELQCNTSLSDSLVVLDNQLCLFNLWLNCRMLKSVASVINTAQYFAITNPTIAY